MIKEKKVTKLLKVTASLAVMTMMLTGCAGREAHPVSVTQMGDDSMSCPAISAQVSANEAQIRNLDGQRETHNGTNAAVAVVGVVLFWPALFALDMTDYEKQEMTALHERDQYLQQLALNKNCGPVMSSPVATTPAPPAQTASAPQATATASTLPYCSAFTAGTACQPKPSQMPNQ
jgi:hypothetical protein